MGIGVSARSLIEEGHLVDIVEIDPLVYKYAKDYFRLPEPNNVLLDDGRKIIEETKDNTYDFILHDVFTGGTVHSNLFSSQALVNIKRIMKSDSVLALVFFHSYF